jgi:hypothetical protein
MKRPVKFYLGKASPGVLVDTSRTDWPRYVYDSSGVLEQNIDVSPPSNRSINPLSRHPNWRAGSPGRRIMQTNSNRCQVTTSPACPTASSLAASHLKGPRPTFAKKLAKKSLEDPRTTCERINETSSAYPLLPYRKLSVFSPKTRKFLTSRNSPKTP